MLLQSLKTNYDANHHIPYGIFYLKSITKKFIVIALFVFNLHSIAICLHYPMWFTQGNSIGKFKLLYIKNACLATYIFEITCEKQISKHYRWCNLVREEKSFVYPTTYICIEEVMHIFVFNNIFFQCLPENQSLWMNMDNGSGVSLDLMMKDLR